MLARREATSPATERGAEWLCKAGHFRTRERISVSGDRARHLVPLHWGADRSWYHPLG